MTDRDSLIALNLISGIGAAKIRKLTSFFGSPSEVLSASHKILMTVPGIGEKLADSITSSQTLDQFKNEVDLAEKAGVKIVAETDNNYPPLLKEIYDAPPVLYIRGELPDTEQMILGVVGTRAVSHYGRKMARQLSESAAHSGWIVASGLAFGVDAEAHRATLNAGGKTIAVLGSGLMHVHPQEHLHLAKEIIETGGALISEFPMSFPPSRKTFPMRNRIISGISHGLLVVEAGIKSGSLITAQFALEQGKSVFAVPGQADNPHARGSNSLIRQGATLTESFDDILADFEFIHQTDSQKNSTNQESNSATHQEKANLSSEEKKILEFIMKERDVTVDQIIAATQIPPGQLLSTLMQLEIKKLITQIPGKRFVIS